MDAEQRQRLHKKLLHLEYRRTEKLDPLGWWQQWATRPHGAPFAPMGELATVAEEVARTDDETAYLVCAHALALATWPGARTPFVGGTPGGLGGALAYAVTIRKWSNEIAQSHLWRLLSAHAQPEPVLEAVTHTARALWPHRIGVDLAVTAATVHLMLSPEPGTAQRGRIRFAKDFEHIAHTSRGIVASVPSR
ncbi:hypothetical protein AB0M72_06815 [Nocardiopsis dassonvillei]